MPWFTLKARNLMQVSNILIYALLSCQPSNPSFRPWCWWMLQAAGDLAHDAGRQGARASNRAAALDYQGTIKHIHQEVSIQYFSNFPSHCCFVAWQPHWARRMLRASIFHPRPHQRQHIALLHQHWQCPCLLHRGLAPGSKRGIGKVWALGLLQGKKWVL